MEQIERKYFSSSQDLSSTTSSDNASASLATFSFAGLFLLIGVLSLITLLVSKSRVWRKPIKLAKPYSQQILSRSFERTTSIIRRFSPTS